MDTSTEATPAGESGRQLRLVAIGLVILLGFASWVLGGVAGPRAQAAAGALCFISIVAACSPDLRRVNWRTVAWGGGLQLALATLILKVEVAGRRPGYEFFSAVGAGVSRFLQFTDAGSRFVFGALANPEQLGQALGPANGLVFAFVALPTIIFVSSFFTVLYYFGVLQFIVRLMARAMMFLMRTSGAETLSAAANVFMGQTEAPIIVKPFVPRMTQSELLAMMVGGMATISGGVMAVYIALGADPVAILTTSVMAAPCGLYLSKLLLPEMEQPETTGTAPVHVEKLHVNAVDAAASGASDGLRLALNVAAMLIAFLAFIALFDFLLGMIRPGLTLSGVFAVIFAPLAFLLGVPAADIGPMADLLGTKLVANEFVAFVKLTGEYKGVISDRSFVLATFALTGFANVASVGIQLGGIGGMAPNRRGDLARLGGRALLAGFIATLVNACVASMLI
ncbi:MAG: Na+ dependent nucleoside transporter domain protein [Acidobacteria bacterium]|nr:Na+ dependent nucleoside transporter domain protein [Acidobacteriota bacterium]